MNGENRPSYRHLALGAAAGLVLALAIGWWFAPLQRADSAPSALHPDYRDEYILMVATSYEIEQDLGLARDRLLLLDPDTVAAPLLELGDRLVKAGSNSDDITRLASLAWVLGETTPLLEPYREVGQ